MCTFSSEGKSENWIASPGVESKSSMMMRRIVDIVGILVMILSLCFDVWV